MTSIKDKTFNGCSGLTSVIIGSRVTSIEWCAFYECYSLINITIPDSVTSIGKYAFNGCSGLTSVIIGSRVTNIGAGAFNNTSLKRVYFNGNESDWRRIGIGSLNYELFRVTCYYYSETKPTDQGNYWYYDTDGVTPVIW